MKLSKLYSNKPQLFEPIIFSPGLNVLSPEIRLTETKEQDNHNHGKTTLGQLIDFNLLSDKNNKFLSFKHGDRFKDVILMLEIELHDNNYLTISRSISEPNKIGFNSHQIANQDFTTLPESQWDHVDIPFDRAKRLLDDLLDLTGLAPWNYGKGLAYLLRTQDDFRDVFKLSKFAGADSDWKPFIAHILGFNSNIIQSYYKIEEKLKEKCNKELNFKSELKSSIEGALANISKINGMLLIKQNELEKKEFILKSFNFRNEDLEKTNKIVDIYDNRISLLNEERYSLLKNRKKIISALNSEQVLFDPNVAAQVFKEAGIFFGGQLKKDFDQLLAFNKAITEERIPYLKEEKQAIDIRLESINSELSDLGKKRVDALSFLTSTDIFEKYKQIYAEVIAIKADIAICLRQKKLLNKLQSIRAEIRSLYIQKLQLQIAIEQDIEICNENTYSLYSSIRRFFNDIIEKVLHEKALFSVALNNNGYLEFSAEIFDDLGNTINPVLGDKYNKILCLAFDMSILRAHQHNKFPKFIIYDRVFESLDDIKKENLLDFINKYTSFGIQIIITLVDSDLPKEFDTTNTI